MAHRLFISYRREGSDAHAGRINDALRSSFDVFLDVDGGIGYGEVFPDVLTQGIERSEVLLAIIGKGYAQSFQQRKGQKDFVLEELLMAKRLHKKIIPILVDNAIMPALKELPEDLAFLPKLNGFEIRTNKFHTDINELKSILRTIKHHIPSSRDTFIDEVLDALERDRLLVLFYQEFTPINNHLQRLKALLLAQFQEHLYQLSVPPYLDDEAEYFGCIAQDCNISEEIRRVNDWYQAMRKRLKASSMPMLLLVINIEEGNEALDKRLASSLRNLKGEFNHFHTILVGRKGLANLVYGAGYLSPLNSARELFFPEEKRSLGENRIVQQFNTLSRYDKLLCKYLNKDDLGRFSAWSSNELINQLFWKNLLINQNSRFVWRGELTKEIGKEILGCASK